MRLRRYPSANFDELSAEETLSLLNFAFEAELDDKLFQRWIVGAQFEVDFAEYKRSFMRGPEKPTEAVLEDVGNILDNWTGV